MSNQPQLPLRRQREGEQTETTTTNTTTQSSTIDRMDDLFSILSSSVNQWYRDQQQQQQQVQDNSNLQATERKKLLSMLGHFLKETYDASSSSSSLNAHNNNNASQQLQENGAATSNENNSAPVADMELTQSLFHLDKTLESAKSYLRREMMLRLKKKAKTFDNKDHSLLMQCKQSSSDTTATSDTTTNNNNKNNKNKNKNATQSSLESLIKMMPAPPIESVVVHNQTPTFVADAFLFDDDDLDEFEDKKWLSRIYCTNCGHTDKLEKTALISHSFSKDGLKFLCTVLLQKAIDEYQKQQQENENNAKQRVFSVVDVGSRLGIVPVAANAYLQRKATMFQNKNSFFPFKVHGVEIDQEYYQIQKMMFEKAKFIKNSNASSTLQAHKTDITSAEGKKLLHDANFVVMNNVFEFFVEREEDQLKCWEETLKGLTSSEGEKKFVVVVPRIEESLGMLRDRIVESNNEALVERIDKLIDFVDERSNKIEVDPETEMLKIAKFCVGIHDDEDEDDHEENGDENENDGGDDKEDSVPREDENNKNNHQHQHDCGDENCGHDHHHHHGDEKGEQLSALMEDFAEIALYEILPAKK